MAFRSGYTTSKATLKAFANAVRGELAQFGVWSTAVKPGAINTGISAARGSSARTRRTPTATRRMSSFLDRKEAGDVSAERVAAAGSGRSRPTHRRPCTPSEAGRRWRSPCAAYCPAPTASGSEPPNRRAAGEVAEARPHAPNISHSAPRTLMSFPEVDQRVTETTSHLAATIQRSHPSPPVMAARTACSASRQAMITRLTVP